MAKRVAKKTTASAAPLNPELLRRVIIEDVTPQVDEGRFPARRTPGEQVIVEADIFADGHDVLAAVTRWRRAGDAAWTETPMAPLGNDRWRAAFSIADVTEHEFTVEGWVDRRATWREGLEKKIAAGQDVSSERLEERTLPSDDGRSGGTRYPRVLRVAVDRERARFGAWYEMFPRSAGSDPARGATFREAEARLAYVASMGFDVLYLPPIHPIGRSFRKGRNNALTAAPGDPGSPWAIGSDGGGHTAVEPALGTLDDFAHFVKAAAGHGLEIAL
ncbi:MAG TPA: maltotransferase domain-containing protein, partial [Vicinamibacterales bacterium]|nr:maltotransferase domain-containing protein [Vicinamibacterales bacterium]